MSNNSAPPKAFSDFERIRALRIRTRDLEVIWLCDLSRQLMIDLAAAYSLLDGAPPDPKIREPRRVRKKLPPMEHPEGEPIAGAVLSIPDGLDQKAQADIQDAFDKKAYQREYMRKKRAEKRGAGK